MYINYFSFQFLTELKIARVMVREKIFTNDKSKIVSYCPRDIICRLTQNSKNKQHLVIKDW